VNHPALSSLHRWTPRSLDWSPHASNPHLSNPRLSNPRLPNPRLSNPRLSNPRLSNLSNPRLSNLSNPRLSNPHSTASPVSASASRGPHYRSERSFRNWYPTVDDASSQKSRR
jgi:hypothetical protein